MSSKDFNANNPRASVYSSDDLEAIFAGYVPEPVEIPFGTDVEGVYFDGYPQIMKAPMPEPAYEVKIEKDHMVTLRDGVRIAVDVYRPDVEGEKFPAILCYGEWGKDSQDIVAWMQDTPQLYWVSPFWNGSIEGCNFTYTVPRGYIHVIGEPRGIGNSEGENHGDESFHSRKDIYDTVEWIAAQPWCDGKVVMMGPSSYSKAQLQAGQEPSPHMVCIRPDEAPEDFRAENFTGIYDPLLYNIHRGAHAFDQLQPCSYNQPEPRPAPRAYSQYTKEEIKKLSDELCEDPDIKYNLKYYPEVRYPASSPIVFDDLLYFKNPYPIDNGLQNVCVPMYAGCCWNNRLYEWGTFEVFRKAKLTNEQKKLIVYPPMFPSRPYAWYHDEAVRWFDYWTKGKDNGIMDEPIVKMFVMGVNKWRFADDWPLPETQWTNYYLHPAGGLSADAVTDAEKGKTESFTSPAPYTDPTVYCLRYTTDPFKEDTEVIGEMALHFDAAIDLDDTNWMVDIVDVAPDGSLKLVSSGQLKAQCRAVDPEKSEPWRPMHPRVAHVPIVPGEVNRYDVALLPTANVFLKGHSMGVIIRNQDDMMGKMAKNGIYFLPFMRTVTHTIHFGESHLVVPVIPKKG